MFFLLAEIFANCRVYNFFHSSPHKFPWQLKTIRSLGKGELELDEKKTVSVSVSKERKNHKKFQLLDKILPSEFLPRCGAIRPNFFSKKKKNPELQANLSQEEREEVRFRRILEGLVTFIPACNATSTNKSRACFGI